MLDKIFNTISQPIISRILSFINSICCTFYMYKYQKTKDTKWISNLSYILFTFFFVDLFLNIYACVRDTTGKTKYYEAIVHHVLCMALYFWGYKIGIHIVPDAVQKVLLFETSTIFLNIRFWIKKYMDFIEKEKEKQENSPFLIFIKKIQPINELIFASLFIYFRVYKCFEYIIYYKHNWIKMLQDGFYFLNRFVIGLFLILVLLNIYWSYIILSSFYKLIAKNTKCSNEKEKEKDSELLLIEKITSQILLNRNNKE